MYMSMPMSNDNGGVMPRPPHPQRYSHQRQSNNYGKGGKGGRGGGRGGRNSNYYNNNGGKGGRQSGRGGGKGGRRSSMNNQGGQNVTILQRPSHSYSESDSGPSTSGTRPTLSGKDLPSLDIMSGIDEAAPMSTPNMQPPSSRYDDFEAESVGSRGSSRSGKSSRSSKSYGKKGNQGRRNSQGGTSSNQSGKSSKRNSRKPNRRQNGGDGPAGDSFLELAIQGKKGKGKGQQRTSQRTSQRQSVTAGNIGNVSSSNTPRSSQHWQRPSAAPGQPQPRLSRIPAGQSPQHAETHAPVPMVASPTPSYRTSLLGAATQPRPSVHQYQDQFPKLGAGIPDAPSTFHQSEAPAPQYM